MEDCVSEENMMVDGLAGDLIIRKDVSVARWDGEKGLAEVTVRKGKLWVSIGVMRSSKLYCNVEEAVYLVGLGILVMLHDDKVMSIDKVYSLLLTPAHGCSWAAYQTFAYLKRLGYIVGRHGVPWTTSRKHGNLIPVYTTVDEDQSLIVGEEISPLKSVIESELQEISTPSESLDDTGLYIKSTMTGAQNSVIGDYGNQEEKHENEAAVSTCDTLRPDFPWVDASDNLDILQDLSYLTLSQAEDTSDVQPIYDVFLPNGRFKKSSPGLPAFRLCISSSQPPKLSEVRALELKSGGVPHKFAVVESGHVSIFSFDRVSLSELL